MEPISDPGWHFHSTHCNCECGCTEEINNGPCACVNRRYDPPNAACGMCEAGDHDVSHFGEGEVFEVSGIKVIKGTDDEIKDQKKA